MARRFFLRDTSSPAAQPGRKLHTFAEPDGPEYLAIRRVAERLEGRARNAFIAAVERLGASASVAALREAFLSGDADLVLQLFDLAPFRDELGGELRGVLAEAFERGAEVAAGHVPTLAGSFDRVQPYAVAWADASAATLVTSISESVRESIRELVRRSVSGGLTSDQLARQIRGLVGLTPRQAAAVSRYGRGLIAEGIAPGRVGELVERYGRRLLNVRADTIARTELITAAGAGQQRLWEQYREEGLFEGARKRWLVTPDDRLDVKICKPMSRQTVGLDESFTTPQGRRILHPPAHPSCRCAMQLILRP